MSVRKINEWALPHVKKFRTYIDIGASVGNTCIPYIDTFETVIAFEPNPTSFSKIKNESRISVFDVALGDREDTALLKIPAETMDPEHGSVVERRNLNWAGPSILVPIKTLDSFNFSNIDFIKIDVEQGELEVVLGALNTIKRDRPVIMFENKRNENDNLIELFLAMGYDYKKHKSDTVVYIKE